MKQKIINKMNEGQEEDVPLYTWETIPNNLKQFWKQWLVDFKQRQ
jgi:hypothetical protein